MSKAVPIFEPWSLNRSLRAWTGAVAAALIVFVAVTADARPAPDGFADLAEKLLPSVVNISTSQVAENPFGGSRFRGRQFPPGSPFEQFFRDFFDRNRPDNGGENKDGGQEEDDEANAPRVTSLGSGFIIDSTGLIVTNNHVIDGAEEIKVTLSDGTDVVAKLLGRDPKTDLALLKVEVDHPLPALPLGDSEVARVGEWVMAIGNPYGLGGTVTVGIISARGRNINAGPYDDFIQVDAPINRGNSGGPLFNMAGEVIGINTAIYSPSGGSIGIGFAIPTSIAKRIISDLKAYGQPHRGWLGVSIQMVTDEIAESLGLEEARGALISKVNEGDPADKAGMIPGDVILEFNDQRIETSRSLQRVVADTPIERKVTVVVWRDGQEKRLQVQVGRMDEEPVEVASLDRHSPGPKAGNTVAILGMVLSEISPEMRESLKLDDEIEGVMVAKIENGSNAADVGLQRGDIIVEVANLKVSNPADVEKQVAKVKSDHRKSVLLGIQRNGLGFIYIAVRLAKG